MATGLDFPSVPAMAETTRRGSRAVALMMIFDRMYGDGKVREGPEKLELKTFDVCLLCRVSDPGTLAPVLPAALPRTRLMTNSRRKGTPRKELREDEKDLNPDINDPREWEKKESSKTKE